MQALVLSLVILAGAPAPKETPVPADLLLRLAEQSDKLARVYQDGGFTIHSVIQNLDRNGKPTSSTEVVTKVTFHAGSEEDEILSRIEDGKDVTNKAADKKRKEQSNGKHSNDARLVSPFETVEQPKYHFSIAGADKDDPSRERIRYVPLEPSEDTYVGEAIVDPATATVIRHECHPAKLPRLVDRLAVVLDLGTVTDAGPTPSALHVSAEGGLFFYRKRVHIESTFDEYTVPLDTLSKDSGHP